MVTIMRFPRSKLLTKIVVFALIIYAGISLINLRGRIETVREELQVVRRAVAEQEHTNSELEYQIENRNDPDVKAAIARANLGLVFPGEIVIYDDGREEDFGD